MYNTNETYGRHSRPVQPALAEYRAIEFWKRLAAGWLAIADHINTRTCARVRASRDGAA